jgi:putative transposase
VSTSAHADRRIHALLRQQADLEGWPPANHKGLWHVIKADGLLLERHAGGAERRHDGRIGVEAGNTRWCSDGVEIVCDNGKRIQGIHPGVLRTGSLYLCRQDGRHHLKARP